MKVRILSLFVIFLLWWLISFVLDNLVMPSPFDIATKFTELVQSTERTNLRSALSISVTSLAYGAALSMILGIPIGIFMGVWRPLAEILEHYFLALYVVPMSALVPLIILWYGNDTWVQVLFILIFTVPQVVVTCYEGVKTVPDELKEVALAFRATQTDIFIKVVIPFVVPFIVTALRLGIGRAVQGMVVAEILLGGTKGIGYLILKYSSAVQIAETLAVVLFVMLLGIIATYIVKWIENAIAPWQSGMVAGSGE